VRTGIGLVRLDVNSSFIIASLPFGSGGLPAPPRDDMLDGLGGCVENDGSDGGTIRGNCRGRARTAVRPGVGALPVQ